MRCPCCESLGAERRAAKRARPCAGGVLAVSSQVGVVEGGALGAGPGQSRDARESGARGSSLAARGRAEALVEMHFYEGALSALLRAHPPRLRA